MYYFFSQPSFGYIINSPEKREPFALIRPSDFSSRGNSVHSETVQLSEVDETMNPGIKFFPTMPLRICSRIRALWKLLIWSLLCTCRGSGEDSWTDTSWAATKESGTHKRCPGGYYLLYGTIMLFFCRLIYRVVCLNIFDIYRNIWYVFFVQ